MEGFKTLILSVSKNILKAQLPCKHFNKPLLNLLFIISFVLVCLDGPEKIVTKQTPTDPFLKKGSNLTLTCSADSDPPAQLKWMFNGVELLQEANITISNLEEKHSGNYSCVAKNVKTHRDVFSPVALVTVQGKSKTQRHVPMLRIQTKVPSSLCCISSAAITEVLIY